MACVVSCHRMERVGVKRNGRCVDSTDTRGPQVVVQKVPRGRRGNDQRDKYEMKPAWGQDGALVRLAEGEGEGDPDAIYCPLWEMVHAVLRAKAPAFAAPAVWQSPSSAGMLALALANLM